MNKYKIPLVKLKLSEREQKSVAAVLKSGVLVQGPNVLALENEFAKLCGVRHAIATNSGTSALHTALQILGIGEGDEVITSPFTFVATANAILMTGAKPVFVDILEDTFNINPELIEKKITKNTKAILPVDLYGQSADYKKINRIAKKHNLFVIEDAAQSIGAVYRDKKTGSLADIACFSLYATKNIIAGEGGMITTNSDKFNKKARLFRSHGQDENDKYNYLGLGYNYRMTEVSAVIAREQLKKINEITNKRNKIAELYNNELINIKGLITPIVKDGVSACHQYTIRVTKESKLSRDELKKSLEKMGIQTFIYYPRGLYSFEHLRFNHKSKDFLVVEKIINEVLSIPVNPYLTKEEIYYIIEAIKKYEK